MSSLPKSLWTVPPTRVNALVSPRVWLSLVSLLRAPALPSPRSRFQLSLTLQLGALAFPQHPNSGLWLSSASHFKYLTLLDMPALANLQLESHSLRSPTWRSSSPNIPAQGVCLSPNPSSRAWLSPVFLAWESGSHPGDLSFPGLQLRCPYLPAVPCLRSSSPLCPQLRSVSPSHRPQCPHRFFHCGVFGDPVTSGSPDLASRCPLS